MIVEMENYKSEVKSNKPKSHRHKYTSLLCYPIFLQQCYVSYLMPFSASNISKEKYSCF